MEEIYCSISIFFGERNYTKQHEGFTKYSEDKCEYKRNEQNAASS